MIKDMYENGIPQVGDVVYRRGSPQSCGVILACAIAPAPHRDWVREALVYVDGDPTRIDVDKTDWTKIWRGDVQVKVAWLNPRTAAGSRRPTNDRGPDDWISLDWLGGCLDELIAATERKVRTHQANRAKAIAFADALRELAEETA